MYGSVWKKESEKNSTNEEKSRKNGKRFTLIEENTLLDVTIAPQKCVE